MSVSDQIHIENVPSIAGLSFRHFRGEEDYPKMIAVVQASAEADNIERTHAFSASGNKDIKYSTRALLLSAPKEKAR